MSFPGTGKVKTDDMFLLPSALTYEAGLPTKARILELWDNAVPDINGTSAETVCSFSPSAGQRDQYHSQGAAQEPSATQIS